MPPEGEVCVGGGVEGSQHPWRTLDDSELCGCCGGGGEVSEQEMNHACRREGADVFELLLLLQDGANKACREATGPWQGLGVGVPSERGGREGFPEPLGGPFSSLRGGSGRQGRRRRWQMRLRARQQMCDVRGNRISGELSQVGERVFRSWRCASREAISDFEGTEHDCLLYSHRNGECV